MQNYPEEWGDEEARVNDVFERLSELKAAGIDAILDLTAICLGHYIPRIATIAIRIDLNIIVATGMYTFDILPFYFRRRTPGSGPGGRRPHGRDVRPRHHPRHRRYGYQGGRP